MSVTHQQPGVLDARSDLHGRNWSMKMRSNSRRLRYWLAASADLISRLRSFSAQATGHERQVICGGVSVEAHRRPLPTRCSLCQSDCVPSTEHVLWSCSCFQSLRALPQPRDPCLARLGWSARSVSQADLSACVDP